MDSLSSQDIYLILAKANVRYFKTEFILCVNNISGITEQNPSFKLNQKCK